MFLTLMYMKRQHDSRVRRTALVAAVATLGLWGSFGASAHADDEPVAVPPVETGESGEAIVAVGAPPVPPTTVVVAVGLPPVPAPPVAAPVEAVVVQQPMPQTQRVQPPAAAGLRSPVDVERITDVIVDVAATVQAGLALIDSRL